MLTDELLDAAGRRGDPVADTGILQHAQTAAPATPSDVVTHVARHLHLPDGSSPPVRAFLDARPVPTVPTDRRRLDAGARFFADHALEIGSALCCASLPAGYASPRGARVLTLTGELTREPKRRIIETAQLVLDVTTEGALEPGARGYLDTRRVRLMHAAIRYFIANDPCVPRSPGLPAPSGGWSDGWGVPLNQEDLLGGMLTFTVTVFEALDRLGVRYRSRDAEAYLHLWCVVASLLGVEPALLPQDRAEAEATAELIRSRQLGPSEDGRLLTDALVGALDDYVFDRVKGVIPAAIHWFLGDPVAQHLGLQPNAWDDVFTGPVRWMSNVARASGLGRDPFSRFVMRELGESAIHGFMRSDRDGDGSRRDRPDDQLFRIPTHLGLKFRPGPAGFHALPGPRAVRRRLG